MSKTTSNDAIWERLTEIDKKIEKVLGKPQENNSSSLSMDELKTEITEYSDKLSTKIEDNSKQLKELNKDIQNTQKAIKEIPIPENFSLNEIKALFEKKDIFRFGFIKFRRTSFIITILGILIFILTVFSMKLYSDSLINQNNYYRQIIITRNLQIENDSLKIKVLLPSTPEIKKKRK